MIYMHLPRLFGFGPLPCSARRSSVHPHPQAKRGSDIDGCMGRKRKDKDKNVALKSNTAPGCQLRSQQPAEAFLTETAFCASQLLVVRPRFLLNTKGHTIQT